MSASPGVLPNSSSPPELSRASSARFAARFRKGFGSDGLNALVSAPAGLAQPARYRRGGYIQRLPDDPWGRPYQYQNPGPDGGPAVFSLGADGAPGGEDENADIYQQ